MFICFNCTHPLSQTARVGRRDECPACGADVHVCRNCLHFEPKVYNECKEPQAELVAVRERANFCDYFSPSPHRHTPADSNDRDRLLAEAEALFKKKE